MYEMYSETVMKFSVSSQTDSISRRINEITHIFSKALIVIARYFGCLVT